jgi:hypothetical protein
MARSSAKKPGPSKCRGSSALIEGRDWVKVGGNKWLREVAEQKGKFIPIEYRPEQVAKTRARAAAAAAAQTEAVAAEALAAIEAVNAE